MAIHNIVVLPPQVYQSRAVWDAFTLLYVGPDQMLPIASALGAVVGFLMIVWHRAVALARRAIRFLMRKGAPEPTTNEPPADRP